jgi:hypothetical protein
LAAENYRNAGWPPFNEGMTEYFTRKATGSDYQRRDKYPFERDFIEELVSIGATDDATLASLYFTGDWESFDKKVRGFAGDWVGFSALLTANDETFLAASEYLKELNQDMKSPLGPEPVPFVF